MKKNLLAASLAIALGSLSGAASAALEVNTNGVGQINVLPYYSVQDSYNTLMTITNTDLENGKAVKVRFRAAEWSDDALDFQIFLSPGDVWTGAFGMVDGQLVLKTSDKSCSLPAQLDGQQFTTIRVEDRDVNRLKEGYVEILTMADIPFHLNDDATTVGADASAVTQIGVDGYSASKSNNPLYKAIKHASNGVPTCDVLGTSLVANNSFESRPATPADPTAAVSGQWGWMVAPTSSLTSSATVIAVQDSKAFTVAGTAIRGGLAADFATAEYFRQANTTVQFGGGAAVDDVTADRLFWPKGTTFATELGAGYPVYQFDMPDLSTPFRAATTPEVWRDELATELQKASLATDYVVAASIGASTDVVLSQPVRRYFYDYVVVTPVDGQVKGVDYNRVINTERYLVGGQNETPYAELTASNRVQVGAPTFFDREEQTFVSSDDIVASPQEPSVAAQFFLEGETSVVSIKNGAGTTGAVGARLTNVDWSFSQNYTAGWAVLSTVAQENSGTAKTIANTGADGHGGTLGARLPVVGFTAINIFNGGAGANGTNYGQVLPLRVLQ